MKKPIKPYLIVVALSLVMILTTAISFTYWKSKITGDLSNKTLDINIGTGNAIETKVALSQVSLDGKVLVPTGRVADTSTETDEITFTVNVSWQSRETLVGTDKDNFEAHTGRLTVRCTEILIVGGATPISAVDMIGLGGPLFDISFDSAFYGIVGNGASVPVEVTITMREPANKAQYDLVAGKGISISLEFVVDSQFDLGNA